VADEAAAGHNVWAGPYEEDDQLWEYVVAESNGLLRQNHTMTRLRANNDGAEAGYTFLPGWSEREAAQAVGRGELRGEGDARFHFAEQSRRRSTARQTAPGDDGYRFYGASRLRPDGGDAGVWGQFGCSGNGLCDLGTGTCACFEEWGGRGCAVEADSCESQPCQNGGACVDDFEGYACDCPSNFTGGDCQLCRPGATAHVCIPCLDPAADMMPVTWSDSYMRNKRSGAYLAGDAAAVMLNSSTPCLNAGTCIISGIDEYTCACELGFFGVHCERCAPDSDHALCSPCEQLSPCLNGATCTDAVSLTLADGGFTCACDPSFNGTLCGNCRDNATAEVCQEEDSSSWQCEPRNCSVVEELFLPKPAVRSERIFCSGQYRAAAHS
jgi:hypothetical protein